ncbi:MAG TPA: ABC transporter permease subunit [Firmicutes bacterium]|nr:ABC transporter permease subunit [Bacillota bacterium]
MGTLYWVSLKEMVRRRTLAITLGMTVLYLAAYTLTLRYAAAAVSQTTNPLMRAVLVPQIATAGLYFAGQILAFFAITSTMGALAGERESGVMQVIATAPVSRAGIVFGKLLGYWTVLAVYSAGLCLGVFLLVRAETGFVLANLGSTLAVFTLEPLLLSALTLLGSAILPTIPNAVVMFSLYAISLLGGVLEQIAGFTRSASLSTIGILTSLLVPADSLYRKAVSLALAARDNPLSGLIMLGPFGAQSPPSIWMLVYVGFYLAACLALTVRLFARRDL